MGFRNSLALFILFFGTVTISMDVTLVTQDAKEFKVPVSLVTLSVTLANLLEDADEAQDIPLPNITSETLATIVSILLHVRDSIADVHDAQKKKEKIKAHFQVLNGPQLIALLHAVNYLDIPLVLPFAVEAAKEMDVTTVPFQALAQLPSALRNAILLGQLVRNFGPILGKQVSEYIGHTLPVYSICALDQGRHIASGSLDKTVQITNLQGIRLTWYLGVYPVTSVCATVSPLLPSITGPRVSEVFIVGSSNGGMINIVDLHSRNVLRKMDPQGSRICSMCATPDGALVIAGYENKLIQVWDIQTGELKKIFKGHRGAINSLAITADGKYIVSGSKDKTLRLWALNKDKAIRTYSGHTEAVTSVCLTEDGKYIISGSLDATIRVWDIDSSKYIYRIPTKKKVSSLCLAPLWHADTSFGAAGGVKIIAGCLDGIIRVFNMEKTETPLIEFQGHRSEVSSLCTLPNTGYIASGSHDKTVRVWDLNGSFLPAITSLQGQQIWEYLQKGDKVGFARYFQLLQGSPGVLGTVVFPPVLPLPVLTPKLQSDNGEPEQKKQKQDTL